MLHSCDTPGLVAISDAISNMLEQVSTIQDSERLPLFQGLNRVLARDVISPINVPPADNSAMDGYAMRSADLATDSQSPANTQLTLVGTALAGQPFASSVTEGQCVRIMTGAVIPQGADAVVMQENTQAEHNTITFMQVPKKGNSVRKAGEDIQQGQVVVTKGTQLTPACLALIASVGIAEVEVTKKIKVGLIATGDELTPPGQPLLEGNIYESNRYALLGLMAKYPVEVVDFGIIKDDIAELRHTFTQANQNCDLVISCGGVSVGDADYVKQVLDELGQINFWKVAIKPGKPFAFGRLSQAWFCGLPGNPVSAYVTFEQLVSPVLNKLSGKSYLPDAYFIAEAAETIRKRPGRADYQRGIFYRDAAGKLWVKANGKQGSGIMSSIANANCYMVLPQESGNITQGQKVKIQPFQDL
ncbi:molybdopterin molybdotransferase MoeA [Paraglaciecola aquimarina]|uniref:Molybdopterin molybdenumtransferase n=1 Tax=Paraglaciecola algarum TaxID=3050085 RepID=A0ABS9DAL4_9ALTE|nr:molybdopterin molybdotransferase MoeA [Paraglaciecola sp. G1-23]MCF2949998.1 molybdopterin molybdotransferase MoeA [Paraglaciecola sp. G1-23]